MKKVFGLLLLVSVLTVFLVGCGEHEIGKDLDKYPVTNDTVEDVELNLYIITDESTSDNAKITVNTTIASYTLVNYHTEVNVHFFTADEYEEELIAAINSPENTEDAPNVVLVNSPELMNSLVDTGKLLPLDSYLDSDAYGTLNVSISSLLAASVVDVNGEDVLLSIPNNHLIGEYEYLVIDKEIAKQTLKYSNTTLASYNTYEATADLRSDIVDKLGLNPDDYVQVVKGDYSLKAQLEAAGKVCNVVTYPIADEHEAFSSAFAIIDSGEVLNDRAMEIIYAINTDSDLRNYLQYGVFGTNYQLEDGKVVMVDSPENVYRMNLLYTGDIFTAFYCDELNWTAEIADSAKKQNAQVVIEVPGQE